MEKKNEIIPLKWKNSLSLSEKIQTQNRGRKKKILVRSIILGNCATEPSLLQGLIQALTAHEKNGVPELVMLHTVLKMDVKLHCCLIFLIFELLLQLYHWLE